MRSRWQAWHVAAIAVLISAAVAGYLFWTRSRTVPTVAERVQRLPASDATLYVDLEALRRAGVLEMLAGQRVSEEPEYRQFVEAIGFDYRQDLDSALVAFRKEDVFVLATGRFDWSRIKAYTTKNGGKCLNGMCVMGASRPGRFISYVPLSNSLVGMASSTDQWAVEALRRQGLSSTLPVPDAPIWAAAPGASLQQELNLPAGTKLFAKALSDAQMVTFGLHTSSSGIEAKLRAECVKESDAESLLNQLRGLTVVFRKYLENVNQKPNPGDLSGVLTSGSFERSGSVVNGRWPLTRAFLDKVLGGTL